MLGGAAFLTDVIFGYGPIYAGFLFALLIYDEVLKNELVVEHATELLGTVVTYLFVVRLLIDIWIRWRSPRPVQEKLPEPDTSDRPWTRLLDLIGIAARLIGRPLEAALAFGLFAVIQWARLNTSEGSTEFWLAYSVTWVAFYLGPWTVGFLQVWEGNGQTLGRALFGLQLQDNSGMPAGFVSLLLRDGLLRPFIWICAYSVFALLLVIEFYLLWIVVPLILVLKGNMRLLLYPFKIIWLALVGGDDSVTLYDLLLGIRIKRTNN
ncbi:MAG: RDD family protein [Chloroflexi bacterium]|nr:RDD family protein [Chloroflexota bacterium]